MIQNNRRSEIRNKGFPGGGDSQYIGLEVGGRRPVWQKYIYLYVGKESRKGTAALVQVRRHGVLDQEDASGDWAN